MRIESQILGEQISTLQFSVTVDHINGAIFLGLSGEPVLFDDVAVCFGQFKIRAPFQSSFVVLVENGRPRLGAPDVAENVAQSQACLRSRCRRD